MFPRAERQLLTLGAAFIAVSLTLGVLIHAMGTPFFDRWAIRHAVGLRDGVPGDVFAAATWIGFAGPLTVASVLVLALLATWSRSWRAGVVVGLAPLVGLLAMALLKGAFGRHRPYGHPVEDLTSFSMPSGHATCSAALAVAVFIIVPPGRWRVPVRVAAVLFTLVVGLSRIVRGMHYPTDVVAGWCLGAGIACVVAAILRKRG